MKIIPNARLTKALGTLEGFIALSFALCEVWWFYGFTSYYFPNTSTKDVVGSLVICILLFAYFVAVTIGGFNSEVQRSYDASVAVA
jgi:hypothetical protein